MTVIQMQIKMYQIASSTYFIFIIHGDGSTSYAMGELKEVKVTLLCNSSRSKIRSDKDNNI